MWTPNLRQGSSEITSPLLNPRDWEKIRARHLRESDRISINTGGVTEIPSEIKVGDLDTRSACWTILTIYVGLGLLSKPFAFAKGGWVSIPILAFLTLIANISGKMLVGCFETQKCRSSNTYADLVDIVLGYWGAVFLIILSTLELLAAVCICQLFIWTNLEKLLPLVPRSYIIVSTTAVALPTTWLTKLSEASWLSFLGFISSLSLIVILVIVRLYYGELQEVDLDNTYGPDIPLSMGVFAISLGGHVTLPQVYREMAVPGNFPKMLNISFCIMFVIYCCTGIVGYSIYGSFSSIVITTNLVENPGGFLPKLAAALVIAKNYLTLSPLVTMMCTSSEVMMGITDKRLTQRIYRSLVFVSTAGLSYLAHDSIPFIESIAGATCTMLTSYIIPVILYAVLKGEIRCTSTFILTFGIAMVVLMTYGSIGSLLHPDKNANTIE